jgi:hypothetical protein
MQRDFGSNARGSLAQSGSTDTTARAVIYEAFVEDRFEAPKQIVRIEHDSYFEPKYEGKNPPLS